LRSDAGMNHDLGFSYRVFGFGTGLSLSPIPCLRYQ
jgi:hypothetical protein